MCGGETLRQLRWFGRSFRRLLSCHPICPGQEEFEESANDGDGQCGVIMRDFAGFVHDPVANGRDSVELRQRPASRNRFHRFKSLAPILLGVRPTIYAEFADMEKRSGVGRFRLPTLLFQTLLRVSLPWLVLPIACLAIIRTVAVLRSNAS